MQQCLIFRHALNHHSKSRPLSAIYITGKSSFRGLSCVCVLLHFHPSTSVTVKWISVLADLAKQSKTTEQGNEPAFRSLVWNNVQEASEHSPGFKRLCLSLLLILSSTEFVIKMVVGFFLFHFGMTSGLPAHLFSYTVCFTNLHCWLIFKQFLSLLLVLCSCTPSKKISHDHVESQNSNFILICFYSAILQSSIASWQDDI